MLLATLQEQTPIETITKNHFEYTLQLATDCTENGMVKWVKEQSATYGFTNRMNAAEYQSWACQHGIQQIQMIGVYKNKILHLERNYIYSDRE